MVDQPFNVLSSLPPMKQYSGLEIPDGDLNLEVTLTDVQEYLSNKTFTKLTNVSLNGENNQEENIENIQVGGENLGQSTNNHQQSTKSLNDEIPLMCTDVGDSINSLSIPSVLKNVPFSELFTEPEIPNAVSATVDIYDFQEENYDVELSNIDDGQELEKDTNDFQKEDHYAMVEDISKGEEQEESKNISSSSEIFISPKRKPIIMSSDEEDKEEEIIDQPMTVTSNKEVSIYESPYLNVNKQKKTICKYCREDIINQHFVRHLETKHKNEMDVIKFMTMKKNTKERKIIITKIRNSVNLIDEDVVPRRRMANQELKNYVICIHCHQYTKTSYLYRHNKICIARPSDHSPTTRNAVSESMLFTALHKKNRKTNDFDKILRSMRGDEKTKIVMNDILIQKFGEATFSKQLKERSSYHISAIMRRIAHFLILMREVAENQKYTTLLSCLKPAAYDDTLYTVKKMSGYNELEKIFEKSPTTALQMGGHLKSICDIAKNIILRDVLKVDNQSDVLHKIKLYKQLVETSWTADIASLAKKTMTQQSAVKPKTIPLTKDIILLNKYLDNIMEKSYNNMIKEPNQESYKELVETTLVSTILHNRKRVGDVQYLTITSYIQNENKKVQCPEEFILSLSESEKVIIKNYKMIHAIGKGSRTVPVMIPKSKEKFFDMIKATRHNYSGWFDKNNIYFFAKPKTERWIQADGIMRKYAKLCGAECPQWITSTRLRKHIATVTQLLSLEPNEKEQVAQFMGHTLKTHEDFYRLPQDVYQTAKISKLLRIMETGRAAEFKNKRLEDINIEEIDEEVSESSDEENEESNNLVLDDKNDKEIEVDKDVLETNKNKSRKRACLKKSIKRWDKEDKTFVTKAFQGIIKKKQFPRKRDIDIFIEKNKTRFSKDDFQRIRNLIVNTGRG